MKYIYFIERKGVKYYKLDTFWSESKDITRSKVYRNINKDLLTSYGYGLEMLFDNNPGKYLNDYEYFNNAYLGYQTLEDDQVHPYNERILIDKPIPIDTTYIFTLNVYENGTNELTDYKRENRERKIKTILDT